ncbi:hypothetical protein D3C72_1327940 [compost metagenome]
MDLKQLGKCIAVGVVTLLGLGMSSYAYAACASPAGSEGQLMWIAASLKVKYCDGTNWVSMNDTATATACSKAGQVVYSSSEIMYCNGTVLVKTAPATLHGACAVGIAGKFYYDVTGNYYWFCNGSNWRRMGP